MKKLFPLLLALPFLLAFYPGGEPTFFSWEPPTSRVDGTPLSAATDIDAYILRCSYNGATNFFEQEVGFGIDNRWNVPQGTFKPGTWVCELYARDKGALVSDASAPVEFLVARYAFEVKPSAPTKLSVG